MSKSAILLLGIGLLVGVVPQAGFSRAEKPRVVVCSGSQESFKEAAEALRESLESKGFDCIVVNISDDAGAQARTESLRMISHAAPDWIAATGSDVYAWAAKSFPSVPIVFLMIPNAKDVFAGPSPEPIGVTSDINPDDWMKWIKLTHPSVSNICILHSDRTQRTVAEFVRAAAKVHLHIQPIHAVSDDFANAVNELSSAQSDGVLMIPDARVYNGPNIQRLLLWGIRTKKPVWGFSQKIAKAGAISSLYANNRDVGRQTADLIVELKDKPSQGLHGVEYPHTASRAVNIRTAELIGITLPADVLSTLNVRFGEVP